MAERRETSVMSSIHEILKDAESREEQEKAEAARMAREGEQRRVDDARRKKEEEEAKLRAEQDERERRTFEEQRRQAEIQAVQDAAMARAKMDAESQARLAEMNARQEHERHLHAMTHDKHKKRLQLLLWGSVIVLVVAGGAAGYFINKGNAEKQALQIRTRELQQQVEQAEADRRTTAAKLEAATDPAEIARLKALLDEQSAKVERMGQTPAPIKARPPGGGGGGGPAPKPPGGPKPTGEKCAPGDPLCAGI